MEEPAMVMQVEEEPYWMDPLISYLKDGMMWDNLKEKRKKSILKIKLPSVHQQQITSNQGHHYSQDRQYSCLYSTQKA